MKTRIQLLTISFFVLITTTAKSQVPSYVPTAGLAAWYSFNGNANDLSGNGNNPVSNNVTFVADANGNPNSAIDFNGSSAWLQIDTPSFTFSETGGFTYSVWMKKRTPILSGVALMSGSGVSGNFISNIQGNTGTAVQFGTNKQGSAWVWATCTNVLNVWDLYTATYNNGAMKLYKNGALQSSATYTNWGAASASLPFYIGKGIQSNSYFNGSMDDLGIWTRALTQTEITNLYNNSPNGISENNIMKDISVYPNPANDFIKVKIGSKQYGLRYSVTDQSGRNLLTGKLNNEITNIDISRLNSGVYILHISESRKQSFSIIKQ